MKVQGELPWCLRERIKMLIMLHHDIIQLLIPPSVDVISGVLAIILHNCLNIILNRRSKFVLLTPFIASAVYSALGWYYHQERSKRGIHRFRPIN